MRGELVTVITDDGLELQGLYCLPACKPTLAILHVHGLAGNFYENRFVASVGGEAMERGAAFLTVNTRGHDYVTDILRDVGGKQDYVSGGGAHELLEDSLYDLEAWCRFLRSEGLGDIVLEGHSTGAVKVVHYSAQLEGLAPKGLILLSPSDDIGVQKAKLGSRYEEVLATAGAQIERGLGDQMMPDEAFEYPVSARTYVDLFGVSSLNGILDLGALGAEDGLLSAIDSPVLVLFGTEAEAIPVSPAEYLEVLTRALCSSDVSTAIVAGAPHNYLGFETEVASIVGAWIDGLLK